MIKLVDKTNKFVSLFDSKTGFYVRSGVIDEWGADTGVDPFMAEFSQLIDVGIMGHCDHGKSGLCVKSGVKCYQSGLTKNLPNMSLENFKKIVDECKGKTFQLALGGRGDCNKHENFKEILEYCKANNIVPNYTTSGFNLTAEEVQLTKENCGAVAVSEYRNEHTLRALKMFIDAGCKTNIHYVLGNFSINEAIDKLENKSFTKGINAVIFLLSKPVGLGSEDDVLKAGDSKVKRFFELIDEQNYPWKIGFDSCSVPGIINNCSKIDKNSLDTCEGGRFSMYISADMIATTCSFDQAGKWAYDLKNAAGEFVGTIKKAWNSEKFEDFRNRLRNSCGKCYNRPDCQGGCPILSQIVLCDRKERS